MLSILIRFSRPWLLFLLIPLLGLTVLPYFKLSKRYRKTRNRITSMALHGLAAILAVFMLSGCMIVNGKANNKNELILLVDVSKTEEQSEQQRDDFVQTVINQAKFENIKVGVVTFGYDQEYAVPLTKDYKTIFNKYKSANLPDVSATNISSALLYAKTLFSENASGKIVLVTDAKETDENAKNIIRSISASGIKIDAAYVESTYEGIQDVQIVNISYPEYHVNKDEEFIINVDIYSNYSTPGFLSIKDNGVESSNVVACDFTEGMRTYQIKHTFTTDGLHEVEFNIDLDNEIINENNKFVSYYYLELYNRVLILEREEGSSESLYNMMTQNGDYEVDVMDISVVDLPKKVEDLLKYDEVIMNNIANSDLNDDFVGILNDYIYNYGGGVLTTGGLEGDQAHAYNRADMVGTRYQQMLPVQAINYTPPVGVIVIIDRSGSMATQDYTGSSVLDYARAGAAACLDALTERDYIGVMTLDSDYATVLELTPRTQHAKIVAAIDTIQDATGGTVFPGAIERAGQALRALKSVDKRHIIIVSDGQVPKGEIPIYEDYAKDFYEKDGITISFVGVNMTEDANASKYLDENFNYEDIPTSSPYCMMLRLTKLTHGKLYCVKDDLSQLIVNMREDLNAPEIKEVNDESFYPTVYNETSSIFTGVEILNDEEHAKQLTFKIDGFNGVKVRASADLLLTGDYNVPLYAQWKYGEGMVGSLMFDIYGSWSSELFTDDNGKRLMFNIVNNLTPTHNIRSNDIKLVLNEDNYTNSLSIYTNLNDGEYIEAYIQYDENERVSLNNVLSTLSTSQKRELPCYTLSALGVENNYSRCKFVIKEQGAYSIVVKKYNSKKEEIGSNTIYKSLTCSEEYNTYVEDEADYLESMKVLVKLGKGSFILDLEDPHEVIDTFSTVIYKEFDPRYLFAVIIVIAFLLDIAVRKFKFLWPHEVYKKFKNGGKH